MVKYDKIPDDAYFALDRISASGLKSFSKSPAHYLDGIKPTAAMEFGTLVHAHILEPETVADTYVAEPLVLDGWRAGESKNKKAYQQWKAEQTLPIVSADDSANIDTMIDNFYTYLTQYTEYSADFAFAKKEQVALFTAQDPLTKCTYPAKAKIDALGDKCIYDIKTVADMSKFSRDCITRQYYRQAEWYLRACEAIDGKQREFVFLAIEKAWPLGVRAHTISTERLEQGRVENNDTLRDFVDWVERGRPRVIYRDIGNIY